MQNLMVILTLFIYERNTLYIAYTPFGQISSRNWKLFVYTETSYLDYFEYVEINGDVQFFFFWPKIFFLCKFGLKIESC